MFFFLRKDLYAVVFVGLLLGFPEAVFLLDCSLDTLLLYVVTWCSFVICWRMCHSEDYSYIAGLSNLARRYSTGLAQVTMLYLMPLFLILHALCTILCLIGLFKGREFAVNAWKFVTEAHLTEPNELPAPA